MLRFTAGITAVLAAVALAACGGSSSSTTSASTSTGTGASGGADAQKVAYSSPVAAQPGQKYIIQGFAAGAKELGWTAESLDANLSADKQVADIATMLTQGVNGIASWTLDPGAAAGAYGQAAAKKVPVVGINSEGEGVVATVWWEINRCDPGNNTQLTTADFIKKLKPNAKIFIIGGPPVPSIQQYVTCFTAAAKKAGLDVIATANNVKDTSAAAQPIVADLLTKHPNVDAIWNYNDASALGASAAVTAASKKVESGSTKGIVITGQNGDADAITAVQDGRLTGTWDPDSVASGLALIKALSGFIGAKKVASPQKTFVVKSTFWTKDNIGEYKAPDARGYTLSTIPLVGASAG